MRVLVRRLYRRKFSTDRLAVFIDVENVGFTCAAKALRKCQDLGTVELARAYTAVNWSKKFSKLESLGAEMVIVDPLWGPIDTRRRGTDFQIMMDIAELAVVRYYEPTKHTFNTVCLVTDDQGFYVAADKLKRDTDLKVISFVRQSSAKNAGSYEKIFRLRFDEVILYGEIKESDLSPTVEAAVWSIFKTYGYISPEDECAVAHRAVKMVWRKHLKKFTHENGLDMLFERKAMLEKILEFYNSDNPIKRDSQRYVYFLTFIDHMMDKKVFLIERELDSRPFVTKFFTLLGYLRPGQGISKRTLDIFLSRKHRRYLKGFDLKLTTEELICQLHGELLKPEFEGIEFRRAHTVD